MGGGACIIIFGRWLKFLANSRTWVYCDLSNQLLAGSWICANETIRLLLAIQSGKGKGIIGKFSKYKEAMNKRGFFNEAEFEEAKTEPSPKAALVEKPLKLPPKLPPKLAPKVAPVKQNETEAEKAERIHRTFEKLLTFVEIVGQVDNYVSTKWKNLVKTVSNLYEEEEDEDYRLGLKKYKGCPVFLKET